MNHLLEDNKLKIDALCQNHKVKTLYAFGSVLTPKFNENSDIDLIVDFKQQDVSEYAANYFNLKFALQAIFNREIDLLEAKAVKNPYFLAHINSKKRLIYADCSKGLVI